MKQKTLIIDYGSGNVRSAMKALERAALNSGCNTEITLSHDPTEITTADRLVLPGVGAFGGCAAGIKAVPGLWDAVAHAVTEKGRPFLGICVGMQLMLETGFEHGKHVGFGWIKGSVHRLSPGGKTFDKALKVPHMGWNTLDVINNHHPVVKNIISGDHAYFVHSYKAELTDPDTMIATTNYADEIPAIIGKNTMIGTQFHPEKSQKTGLKLLAGFLEWKP